MNLFKFCNTIAYRRALRCEILENTKNRFGNSLMNCVTYTYRNSQPEDREDIRNEVTLRAEVNLHKREELPSIPRTVSTTKT